MMTPEAITLFASAARTASANGDDNLNRGHRGLHVVVDLTAVAATETVTVTIQGKDRTSGKYYTILASAALGSVATTVLRVFDGATAAANTVANDALPEAWRVITTHSAAGSHTYSIGASLIP